MTQKILLDHHDNGVIVITFNRPETRNALDTEAMRAFGEIVTELHADPVVRVVILTGAGDTAFCAGADLVEMTQRPSADEGLAMITLMGDALLALERLPVPVIGAINGYALGGGGEISMACDLRVVDANVRLGFVQAKRGLIPGWGGGQRLLRLVGYTRAMELLLTAKQLNADELESWGMINRIAPAGRALPAALEFAGEIAKLDPAVIRAMKAMLQAGLVQPYDAALMTERALFPALWAGEARIKSTQSFADKSDSKRKQESTAS